MNALKMLGLNLDLLEHLVMAHFERLRSMCDHSANFCNLSIFGWICCMLLVMIARSSAYAVVVHVEREVLKWYPNCLFLATLGVVLKI